MKRFKGRIYTGPTGIPQIAQHLREAGITVTIEGTAHIYFTNVEADYKHEVGYTILAAVESHFGIDPLGGWRWLISSVSDVKEVETV